MHLDVGEGVREWLLREAKARGLSVNGMVKVILHAAWQKAVEKKEKAKR
jgi:hypothetical protein